MYRNSRSKGIKIKSILQVCLLLAVCFWLIFQVKRSRDKNKDFDATRDDDKVTMRIQRSDEIVKFGRKDLPDKLDQTVKEVEKHEQEEEEDVEEVDEDNKGEEEEKIDKEKDDKIDENDQQQKSDIEIEREEVDIIDEDKENEESGNDKENEEKEEESQNDNTVEIDEEHTHELREEHYKADDASSAVTHDGRLLGTENEIKNGTLENSSENVGQEIESGPLDSSVNPASSIDDLESGPPSNTTVIEQVSNSTNEMKVETDEGESENLETSDVIEGIEETLDSDEVQHLEEKEVQTDLDTLPEIETEGGNSEDTAEE